MVIQAEDYAKCAAQPDHLSGMLYDLSGSFEGRNWVDSSVLDPLTALPPDSL